MGISALEYNLESRILSEESIASLFSYPIRPYWLFSKLAYEEREKINFKDNTAYEKYRLVSSHHAFFPASYRKKYDKHEIRNAVINLMGKIDRINNFQ